MGVGRSDSAFPAIYAPACLLYAPFSPLSSFDDHVAHPCPSPLSTTLTFVPTLTLISAPHREKLNSKILFDEDGWARLLAEVPKMKVASSP
jgi:hypothetical protein